MNLQITFQENAPVKDSFGQEIESWKDVPTLKNIWASMKTTGGGEFYAAQKINAETTALFKIRYIAGVDAKMRILYGGRYYEILNINDANEQHEFINISCKAVI